MDYDTRHHRPDEPHHPGDHERTDANIRRIAFFAFGMVVVAVLIHYALGWMMNIYSIRQASVVGNTRPVSDTLSKSTQPPLQVNPAGEVEMLRAQEKDKLERYSWVDRKAGIVRIPIERAIELTVERGLPTRDTSSPQNAGRPGKSQRDRSEDRDRSKSRDR